MATPLHSSFTLRPCSGSGGKVDGQELTLRHSFSRVRRNNYHQQRKTISNIQFPFESLGQKGIPTDFQPPSDQDYWKKRCFHWQDVCQKSRKRVREMEEDQRQLRRRIWELEERLSSQDCGGNNDADSKVPISVASSSEDRPPAMVVTVPKNIRCCFYLTDGEGLSDSDDYADCVDDENNEDTLSDGVDDDDCVRDC